MGLKVARSLDELAALSPRASAVTLGVFDGVHRGHQRIIERLVACREDADIESLFVLTFDPHPIVVTHSLDTPPILSTIDERLELLEDFAIDGVFVVPFDEATARIDYREFIDSYLLDAMDMRKLVLGYDCHFGYRRAGSPERVTEVGRERGFDVEVVPALRIDAGVVSSSEIRKALAEGSFDHAIRLLGHPYLVRAKVVQGQGIGSDIGFPTANLSIVDEMKLWPPQGVYVVSVDWMGRRYGGMMNVGLAPTVRRGTREIEVHIFDFDHTIFGDTLSVRCLAYLREEREFPSLDALIEQLDADRRAAREILDGV